MTAAAPDPATLRVDTGRTVAFSVAGRPIPQGSKRALGPGRLVDDNRVELAGWRAAVTLVARTATRKAGGRLDGSVRVDLRFTFRRPKRHYTRAGELHAWAPLMHNVAPDVDKLARAVLDALTAAGTIVDDRTVAALDARKVYGPDPTTEGVYVRVTELAERLS